VEGSVDSNGKAVHLTLTFSAGADGLAKAVLVLVDQGGLAIPASAVVIGGKDVAVELRAISAAYRGSVNAAGELAVSGVKDRRSSRLHSIEWSSPDRRGAAAGARPGSRLHAVSDEREPSGRGEIRA